MAPLVTYTCRGRAVDDTGHSSGPECGRVLTVCNGRPDVTCKHWTRHGTAADQARVRGWRLGTGPDSALDVMCPDCARPDPATVRTCRELTRPGPR